uniref:Uncharacterized protein n=1 Tax=Chelydra serpentina TaxID=8475 RepID=A0A8C3SJM1_CHESE
MAPNPTGVQEQDHQKWMTLCCPFGYLPKPLVAREDHPLYNLGWIGGLYPPKQTAHFQDVTTIKPQSSRKESAESCFLAKLYRKGVKHKH